MSENFECKMADIKIIQVDGKKEFIDEDAIYDEVMNNNSILYVQCGKKRIYPQAVDDNLKFNLSDFNEDAEEIFVGIDGNYTKEEKESILVKILSLCPLSVQSSCEI